MMATAGCGSTPVLIWTARGRTTRHCLPGIMDNKPISRVLVTHMHPDHVGLAGWLVKGLMPNFMSRTDCLMCRAMAGDTGLKAPDEAIRFYHRAGFSESGLALRTFWRLRSAYIPIAANITTSSKMMSWRLAGASGRWKLAADTRRTCLSLLCRFECADFRRSGYSAYLFKCIAISD